MPKYSVIVPVYNSEKYLRGCIESITSQTFSDFELILIEDGSPDGCGKICDEYALNDPRVKAVHKENGGASSARNRGLDVAEGEYIVFIDSDDTIPSDYLETFSKLDCDINICGFKRCFVDGECEISPEEDKNIDNATDDILLELMQTGRMYTAWGKVIKRELIMKAGNLRFKTNISYGEDTMFVMTVFKYCKTVGLTSKTLYYYNKCNVQSLTSKLTVKLVHSCFAYDKFVEAWLCELNMRSDFFSSMTFPTKQKIKWAFCEVFEDVKMSMKEKYKWYKIFFKNDMFRKNTDVMFADMSGKIRFCLKTGSPVILLMYQYIASKKSKKTLS